MTTIEVTYGSSDLIEVTYGAADEVTIRYAGVAGPQGETGATGATGAGVPVGGASGQVLVKNSSTDYDDRWDNLAFSIPIPATGYRFVPGVSSTSRGSFTHANGIVYYWPVVVRAALTFDAFAVSVATARASSSVRQAIYRANSTWGADGLVIQSGLIDSSTTGEKIDTVTKTTLAPGRYLLASRSNDAVAVFGATVIWPDLTLGGSDANALFHQWRWLGSSEAFGVFTDPPPTIGITPPASGQSVCPVVLRSAAP